MEIEKKFLQEFKYEVSAIFEYNDYSCLTSVSIFFDLFHISDNILMDFFILNEAPSERIKLAYNYFNSYVTNKGKHTAEIEFIGLLPRQKEIPRKAIKEALLSICYTLGYIYELKDENCRGLSLDPQFVKDTFILQKEMQNYLTELCIEGN